MSDSVKNPNPFDRRPPRVAIGYDVEVEGAEKRIEPPLVVGVLADLSGRAIEPLARLRDRKMIQIDSDNFADVMSRVSPGVALKVPNALTGEGEFHVELTFQTLGDFSPLGVARKVEPLRRLLDERTRLSSLLGYLDGKTEAQDLLEEALCDAEFLQELAFQPESEEVGEAPQAPLAGGQVLEVSGFLESLYHSLNLRSDVGKENVEKAIYSLANAALNHSWVVSDNYVETVEGVIAEFDRVLTKQINPILHHDDFQALKSFWCGLAYLVFNTETDRSLKIKVMNITKRELFKDLHKAVEFDQSQLFKKLYENEFGVHGGEPYACVVGDYYIDHSHADIELLEGMAQISAASNMVFLAGASPFLFQMDSWLDLPRPRDLSKIFESVVYAAWRKLRETEDARYVGLAVPRFLARSSYGAGVDSVDSFAFEDDMQGEAHHSFAWVNAAYALAFNTVRAFRLYGWCANICGYETGGAIENLPLYWVPDEQGGRETVGPTEVNISERREAELAGLGICAFVHRKGTDVAVFLSTPSLQKPLLYYEPDATQKAKIAADLAYVQTTCQFIRVIRLLIRDKLGSFMDLRDSEVTINRWLNDYVEPNRLAGPIVRARHPLLGAEVKLKGEHSRKATEIFLMPYYQLERLHSGVPNSISLRLELRPESG